MPHLESFEVVHTALVPTCPLKVGKKAAYPYKEKLRKWITTNDDAE